MDTPVPTTKKYNTTKYDTTQYNALQQAYNTMCGEYNTMQHNTTQYNAASKRQSVVVALQSHQGPRQQREDWKTYTHSTILEVRQNDTAFPCELVTSC